MRYYSFTFFMVCALFATGANAAINVVNNNNATADWRNDTSYQEAQEIAILENDIRLLDQEIEKCKKKKNAWTAATIVGGVGVVGTGVAAIVQANKIKDKKADLADKQSELKNLKSEESALK